MKPRPSKRLLLDLDGVLFPYSRGWDTGSLYESPMPGAVEAVNKLVGQGFTYVVFTTRMYMADDPIQQRLDISNWLNKHGFPPPEDITCQKMPCLAYVDDRAIRFTNWNDIRRLWG